MLPAVSGRMVSILTEVSFGRRDPVRDLNFSCRSDRYTRTLLRSDGKDVLVAEYVLAREPGYTAISSVLWDSVPARGISTLK